MKDITIERNLVWKEVKDADAYMRCARLIVDIHLKIKLWCEYTIIILSILGITLSSLECKGVLLSIIFTLITAIVEKVLPNLFTNYDSVPELRELACFFEEHRTKAIEIFNKINTKQIIDSNEAMQAFKDLSNARSQETQKLDSLIKWFPKSVDDIITKKSDEYLNEIFNYEQ